MSSADILKISSISSHRNVVLTIEEFNAMQFKAAQVGNPSPLGLASFALTTFVLSAFNTGLPDKSLERVVLPLALFYGGLCQIIAGIWEFKVPNTFAATAFCSYGGFWLSLAWYIKYELPSMDHTKTHIATGLFLLAWAVFTLYMLIASVRTTVAVLVTFCLLEITFILLTIGTFEKEEIVIKIGGWFGIVTALAAWYASSAMVINSTWQKTVLPIGECIKAK